jgi:cell wall-associated NlpC family hydrolase
LTARDPRLHAYRPDLADERLRGEVDAARFVMGRPARVAVAVADIHREPRPDSGLNTQAIYGDDVCVFDVAEGWAWIQNELDGYVGYAAADALTERAAEPTHIVCVPRTFLYPGPDLKQPRTSELSIGSRVTITGTAETRGTEYALLASGEAVIAKHLAQVGKVAADFVAVAETLIHTPYLWAGVSGFGIDCSGLVQLSMRMAGRSVLRDSDMQAATVGVGVDPGADCTALARGDLAFWDGHVGIMADADTLIHASGHTMTVAREPLRQAIDRIGYLYGGPTGFRRPG